MSESIEKLLAELSSLADELTEEAKEARAVGMDFSVQHELRDKLRALVRRYRREQ